MAARQFQLLLLSELLVYGLFGGLLVARSGWSVAHAAELLLAIFLALRLIVVMLTFFLSVLGTARVSESGRLPLLLTLRVIATEFGAMVLLFAAVIPFERIWLAPDRLGHGAARRTPLLLIHGYQCNRGFWFWLRRKLEAAGWTVGTHDLEPVYGSIDDYSEGIARRIDDVLAATGAEQVILVGHSMGGLASRAYLRRYGTGKVAKLVSLGTPHQGSYLARFGLGVNARQMRIGSLWLAELAANETLPPGSVSISSQHDSYVQPGLSRLAPGGGRDVVVSGVGHLGLVLSAAVFARLREALEAP